MKSRLTILLLFAIFISCDSQKENTKTLNAWDKDTLVDEPTGSIIIDTSSDYVISNANIGGKNAFSFKFNTDSVGAYLRSIDVFSEAELLQNITVERNTYRQYRLVDWNFDGYKDISIEKECGSGGCTYLIWNYEPYEKIFIYNKELSENFGLERDSINKQIIIHRRGGYSFETWEYFEYSTGDKLVFIKSREAHRNFDSLGQLWEKNILTEFVNNKLASKVDSFIID